VAIAATASALIFIGVSIAFYRSLSPGAWLRRVREWVTDVNANETNRR
jgi:hypothetical protein